MTMLIPVLLLLGAWPFAAPGRSDRIAFDRASHAAVEEHGCLPAHRGSESMVRTFLTNPLLPEVRARFDMGTAAAEDVQLLTTARDRDSCDALWAALRENGTDLTSGDQVAFYRSGDRFFVPISRVHRGSPSPPGTVHLDGPSSLDVYDAQYRLIGRFAA